MLKDELVAEKGFHGPKGEYVAERNGNRIALIFETIRNEDGNRVLGIKHARYLKGKPKKRKMVER